MLYSFLLACAGVLYLPHEVPAKDGAEADDFEIALNSRYSTAKWDRKDIKVSKVDIRAMFAHITLSCNVHKKTVNDVEISPTCVHVQ